MKEETYGQKQNLIPLQELNLTSRFLFDEVPRELAEFLHYLEETTDERAASTRQPADQADP